MTKEKQIIAIAELDGWKQKPTSIGYWDKTDNGMYPPNLHPLMNLNQLFKLPDYLNSRDVIIPVIEKQSSTIKTNIVIKLYQMNSIQSGECWCNDDVVNVLLSTTSQLAEALLRATGNWED